MENEKARIKRLLDCFNLSVVDWQKIDDYQGGLCFICQTRPRSGKRLATDHDHDTGLVRGLLCNHCNHLLGKIENALKRHPAKEPLPLWAATILNRLIAFLISPPAIKALGRSVYGYPGRVGTKKHRADLKRKKKQLTHDLSKTPIRESK